MKTLFIDRKETTLHCQQNHITIRNSNMRKNSNIPLSHIDMVVISAPLQINTQVLSNLTAAGITTIILNPKRILDTTITYGFMHNDATRRLKQYRVIDNPDQKLYYAKNIVKNKLQRQMNFLSRAKKRRKDLRQPLSKSFTSLSERLKELNKADDTNQLRGYEGAAASAYFSAYKTLFSDKLSFHGRNRRPPKDPVNVILSLTYTLLHISAVRALISYGFDPFIGIYHEPAYGRESLACDLVEIVRPKADQWVWQCFAQQQLKLEYFYFNDQAKQPCTLGKTGRKIYYEAYAKQSDYWDKCLRNIAKQWLTELTDHPVKTHGS